MNAGDHREGVERSIALLAVYLGANILLGNIIDPILIGRHLRLSPIVVLVSLVFWGWTWGIIGAFLAVPLTITLRVALQSSERWGRLAALMGPIDAETAPSAPVTRANKPDYFTRSTRRYSAYSPLKFHEVGSGVPLTRITPGSMKLKPIEPAGRPGTLGGSRSVVVVGLGRICAATGTLVVRATTDETTRKIRIRACDMKSLDT